MSQSITLNPLFAIAAPAFRLKSPFEIPFKIRMRDLGRLLPKRQAIFTSPCRRLVADQLAIPPACIGRKRPILDVSMETRMNRVKASRGKV
jgi:hypothetical protein